MNSPRRTSASKGGHLGGNHHPVVDSEWTPLTPAIHHASEISRFFMAWEKHTAALRLFFLQSTGTMWMYKCLFSKSQQLSLGRGSSIRWPSTLERNPPSEIRLPLPSAGFWSRAASGVQMVTLVVYGFGEGWMNRLGYLLNLVLACNVLLHERLSGSGQIEHTGSNTAGPREKAFTCYLLKILSLNGDYIRWPPVNLSFEVSSTTLSLIHLIQHEKPSVSQTQSTECERDSKT